MLKKYIKTLINKFPDIASGRKNFKLHELRIKKNLLLTEKYSKNKKKYSSNKFM